VAHLRAEPARLAVDAGREGAHERRARVSLAAAQLPLQPSVVLTPKDSHDSYYGAKGPDPYSSAATSSPLGSTASSGGHSRRSRRRARARCRATSTAFVWSPSTSAIRFAVRSAP